MESFGKNQFQNITNSSKVENSTEKLDVKIERAQPDDWEACKIMRIKALESADSGKLETNSKTLEKKLEFEKQKTEEEWRKELSSENTFIFLPKKNQVPIGIGRISQIKKNIWILHNGYIEKEFQGKGIGKKMFVTRLNEIIKHGGIKAWTSVKVNNEKMLHLAKSFGFREMTPMEILMRAKRIISKQWKPMETDLTNPEILKKIKEVLNEK